MRHFLIVLLLYCSAAGAENAFISGKEEGWFWKKDPPEPIEEPEPLPPPSEPLPPVAVDQKKPVKQPPPLFSVKWLRAQLPILRDRAIDNPTKKNVRAYLYAQRVMFDKADRFSSMFARVSKTDPLLDENNRFPFASAFRATSQRAKKWGEDTILRNLSKKLGVFFFFSADCKFCQQQLWPLKQLNMKYGFTVMAVSKDGRPVKGAEHFPVLKDQGQSKAWNITVWPAIVLVHPPDKAVVITQGFLSTSALESRILIAAEEMGELSDEELKLAHASERGLLATGDMNKPEGVDPNDPDAWIEYLRKRIGVSMSEDDPILATLPDPTAADNDPRFLAKKKLEDMEKDAERKNEEARRSQK